MWQMVAGRLARVVLVAAVLAAGLGFVGASGAAAQSVADVEVRDRLVADQEALLNVYRCMFDVDTGVVPGGCADGAPVLPAEGPAPFSGNPTAQDVTVRDQLIADQEALLNAYRCQFSIDTELVPGRCLGDDTPSPIATPTEEATPLWFPSDREFTVRYLDFFEFIVDCGRAPNVWVCDDPQDEAALIQLAEDLFGCAVLPRKLTCVGMNLSTWGDHVDGLRCLGKPGYGVNHSDLWCYHWSHEAWRSIEPYQEPAYPDLAAKLAELTERFLAAEQR